MKEKPVKKFDDPYTDYDMTREEIGNRLGVSRQTVADIEKKAAELALEREKMIRADDRERDRIAQDGVLRRQEMELKYGVSLAQTQAEIDAKVNMDRERMQLDAIAQAVQPMQ